MSAPMSPLKLSKRPLHSLWSSTSMKLIFSIYTENCLLIIFISNTVISFFFFGLASSSKLCIESWSPTIMPYD